ncbi:MAG: hypothetical protein J3R72DRAFT_462242 [Linnemannia gamsii]|nr:MAG: hypothetical protein J3R72DRAFT_462242 [Linnemannia gamsii]
MKCNIMSTCMKLVLSFCLILNVLPTICTAEVSIEDCLQKSTTFEAFRRCYIGQGTARPNSGQDAVLPYGGSDCSSQASREARESANAAHHRLDALNEASARARADPRYVHSPISPYHYIKGAEAEFNRLDSQARQ